MDFPYAEATGFPAFRDLVSREGGAMNAAFVAGIAWIVIVVAVIAIVVTIYRTWRREHANAARRMDASQPDSNAGQSRL